ncbi:MAG: outer membrane beta-barrel domain-containing protein [Bradymonadaceae bacterium]
MDRRRWLSMLAGIVVAVSLAIPTAASAADQESPLAGEQSVRRKLLYRSTRFEVAPMFGITMGDAYLRDGVVGATGTYWLTNEIGLTLTAGYGLFHAETDLAKNTKKKLEERAPDKLEDMGFAFTNWLAGLEFAYVPIFGKVTVMNSAILQYDFHLMGGFTLVGRGACKANEPGTPCGQKRSSDAGGGSLGGIRPAGTIGLGFRTFFAERYAVKLQLRDHLYRRAEVSTGKDATSFSNNFMMTLGVSFFFPKEVKISR